MFSVHIIIIYRYVLEYYTDWHDVDENMVTISNQGGYYSDGESIVGIVRRNVNFDITGKGDIVASKKNNIRPPILLGGYVMYYITTSPC